MCNPNRPEPQPHHHHHNRPDGLVSFFANLKGTGLPWRQVLRMAASNLAFKVRARRGCCGDIGQPGC